MMAASVMARRVVFLLGVCVALAWADDVPPIRPNSFELGGFVGASYGIDSYRVMGGGNISYGVTTRLLPYFEYTYLPGIQRTETTDLARNVYTLNLHDIHAGVHYRIPIGESKWVPYGVFGVGVIHQGPEPVQSTFLDTGQVTTLTTSSSNSFAVNFGGGFRYYFDQHFGIRAEAKEYKPTGAAFNRVFGKVEFGFYYQFR